MSEQRGRAPLADVIIPLAAIAFTVYYIWSVNKGPWEAKFSAYLVGIPLLIASAIFLLITLWRHLKKHLPAAAAQRPDSFKVNAMRLALLALTLGYLLMIDYGVGFTLSNFIFLTCAIVLLTDMSHLFRATAVAATLSILGYLLFIVAFDARFPEGPVERALAGLFS